MAWLTGYTYRQKIDLAHASGVITDHRMLLTVNKGTGTTTGAVVYLQNHALSWASTIPNDMRFATSDGSTQLKYWIESSDANTAQVWIKFDSIGTSDTYFYIYYGKASDTTTSSGADTFIFFDDASSDGSANYTLRDLYASGVHATLAYVSPSAGYTITMTGVDTVMAEINALAAGGAYRLRAQLKMSAVTGKNAQMGLAMRYTTSGVYWVRSISNGTKCLDMIKEPTPPNTSVTQIGVTNYSASYVAGTWYWFMVTAVGSALTAWSEWQDKSLSVTDTDYTTGTWGILGGWDSGLVVNFINVCVMDYIATEAVWGAWGAEEIVDQTLLPSSIATAEAFGTTLLAPGPVNVLPSSIETLEAFGTDILVPGAVNVLPTGIVSEEKVPCGTISIDALATGSWAGVTMAHGFLYYNGYLYTACRSIPAVIAKADLDLTLVSAYTPTHGETEAHYFTDLIVAGGYLWTMDSQGWLYKIDPAAFTTSGSWKVVNLTALGSSALCSDGTYVYGTGRYGCFKFLIAETTSDDNQTTIDDYSYLYSGFMIRVGTRKTIAAKGILTLQAYLKKVGSPTGNVTFAIRRVSDDSLIDSKVWGDAADLGTTGAWKSITFTVPQLINEEVRVFVEYSGGDSNNKIGAGYATSNVKANEKLTVGDEDEWADYAAYDFSYQITYGSYSENPYIAYTTWLHSICEDEDYLYVNDASSTYTPYLRKVLKSDLSEVGNCEIGYRCTDDIAQDDDYVYLGREFTSYGVCRVAKAALTASIFGSELGRSDGCYILADNEGIDRLIYIDRQYTRLVIFSIPDCTILGQVILSGLLGEIYDSETWVEDIVTEIAFDAGYIYTVQHCLETPTYAGKFTRSDIFLSGTLALLPGAVNLLPSPITSLEAFGTAILSLLEGQTLLPSGIVSAEAIGTLAMLPGAVNIIPGGTEEQLTGTSGFDLDAPWATKVGQVMTINNRTLRTISFKMRKYGTPEGNITFSIRKVSDDSVIANKVWGNATSITTSFVWYEVTLDTPVLVNEAIKLCSEFSGGDESNAIQLAWTSAAEGDVKANEYVSYWRTTVGPWDDTFTGRDLVYKYSYSLGIASLEAFGTAILTLGAPTIFPSGIVSAEAFGTAIVLPGAVNLLPSGIVSLEAFGITIIRPDLFLLPSGIVSLESFGITIILPGAVNLLPSGIASLESFGTAIILPGEVIIIPVGIVSAEAFGTAIISSAIQSIIPTGIVSAEAFGTLEVSVVGRLLWIAVTTSQYRKLKALTTQYRKVKPLTTTYRKLKGIIGGT